MKRIIAILLIGIVLGILANGIEPWNCRECPPEYVAENGRHKGIDIYVFGHKIIRISN